MPEENSEIGKIEINQTDILRERIEALEARVAELERVDKQIKAQFGLK